MNEDSDGERYERQHRALLKYALVWAGLVAVLLALFALAELLGVPLLTDPSELFERPTVAAAFVGVALLVVDVALPVPSSLVMVAHGALFGVVVGTLLSLLGAVGAVLVGFWIGRSSRPLVHRITSADERRRAETLLARFGAVALVITRPVPVLAESVAIFAGVVRLPLPKVVVASVIGGFVPALVYAVAGSLAAGFASSALLFIALVAAAVLFAFAERFFDRRRRGPAAAVGSLP